MNESRILLPILFTLAGAPTARAASDDICVRQAVGVPYDVKPTPEWWNKSLSPSKKEARWTGATARTATGRQSSAPHLARSRMIWDQKTSTVFFEFEVNGDPSIDRYDDTVMLALSDDKGIKPELFIYFEPLRGCSKPSDCTGEGKAVDTSKSSRSVQYASYSSGKWGSLNNASSSTNFTIEEPWVKVGLGDNTTYNWTLSFKLRVPTTDGHIRPNLRVYGNVEMMLPNPAVVDIPLLCNPSASNTEDCLPKAEFTATTDRVPINTIAQWPVLRSRDPSSCKGIEVIRELVGSDYQVNESGTVPGTSVSYPLPGSRIPRTQGAKLRAGFHNDTDIELNDGDIEAEFYIANWGAQYYTVDDSAHWNKVFTEPVLLSGTVAAGRYAGQAGQGTIESRTWVPDDSGLELEADHQCMFVRLESRRGGVPFKVDSVYRNMDLVSASVARRAAVIDLGNRPLPKGKRKHDVYLLVRTENMPDTATCRASKGKRYGCAKGGPVARERRALTKAQKKALTRDFKAGRTGLDQAQYEALLDQKTRKGKKVEELPFVVTYAMVDTGRRIDLPGAPGTPVLQHFSEYGYYVEHEGDLEGWETYVHGVDPSAGAGQNLFKLEVEHQKVAAVANTVRVLNKETRACKKRPSAKAAVYDPKKIEKLEAKLLTEVAKGKGAKIRELRITDDQLGCDPPPLRKQCKRNKCGALSPAAHIEGSRYVGDWKAVERTLVESVSKPSKPSKPKLPKAGKHGLPRRH